MANNSKELMLEILSEESAAPLSSQEEETSFAPVKQEVLTSFSDLTPSPFKGLSLEERKRQGEGKDQGKINGVIVGRLEGINEQAKPLVNFHGNLSLEPIEARSTVQLDNSNLDQDVVLMFDQGDKRKPIIMGILAPSNNTPDTNGKNLETVQVVPTNVDIDGERMIFTAKKEIVLKCGKASITLTKAGKILIRGAYLLSRSSGVNRVKGGVVHVN